MPQLATNVLGKSPLLTKSVAKAILSQSVRRVMARYDGSEGDLGESIGSTGQTINNIVNQNSLAELHTVCNLMLVDPYVLDGILNYFGRRSVPVEAKCNTDALVPLTRTVSKLAEAKADGEMTDREVLAIEPDIEAAMDALFSLKQRCDDIRKERAA